MDDGLQNSSLVKEFTLAVVDGRRGIGNACVFPAGPLRAPLAAQIVRADALLIIGGGHAGRSVGTKSGLPVFHAHFEPDPTAVASLTSRQVLAFAGIGDPDKFFTTASEAGISIAERRLFPDHHRFTAEQAAELIMHAEHNGLTLLTTEKDGARMKGEPALAALAAKSRVLPVTLALHKVDELRQLTVGKLRR
jgi:tetraacyldisaccharide 4'-kinase